MNTTFNQIIGTSKYSNKNIQNRYQTFNVNSGTTNYPLATLTSGGTWTQGYVFMPYMSIHITEEEYRKWKIERLKIERKDKLEKLNKLN